MEFRVRMAIVNRQDFRKAVGFDRRRRAVESVSCARITRTAPPAPRRQSGIPACNASGARQQT